LHKTPAAPPRRRYVLVRRTSGELVFEQDDTDFVFDQVMA
jgi:hypothetical protein